MSPPDGDGTGHGTDYGTDAGESHMVAGNGQENQVRYGRRYKQQVPDGWQGAYGQTDIYGQEQGFNVPQVPYGQGAYGQYGQVPRQGVYAQMPQARQMQQTAYRQVSYGQQPKAGTFGKVVKGVAIVVIAAILSFLAVNLTRRIANAKGHSGDDGSFRVVALQDTSQTMPEMSFELTSATVMNDDQGEYEFRPTITENHVTIDGYSWGYWLYRARPDAKGQPLILSLHGSGESGDNLGALQGTSSLSRWILDGSLEPDCDVLMPQCPGFGWDTGALHSLLMQVTDELGSDMSRLGCTGVSMGGFGTWDLLSAYPTLFATAAPIASSGTNFSA